MKRQKKNKSLQVSEETKEVTMIKEAVVENAQSEEMVLDNLQSEIDLARKELENTKFELSEKKKELEVTSKKENVKEEKKSDENTVSLSEKKRVAKEIEKQKQFDNVKVTGKFINRRAPGQSVKLPYIKYADDPVKWHTFLDGKVYTIPRGFADQINGGDDKNPCYYTPVFIQKEGIQHLSETLGENSAIAQVDTSNKKYSFVPVNF